MVIFKRGKHERQNRHERPAEDVRRAGSGKASAVAAVVLIGAATLGFRWYAGRGIEPAQAASEGAGAPPARAVVYHTARRADMALMHEYVGQVEAVQYVSIRPQVAGEIQRVHFEEGSMVKEGDVLFTIDQRQYQATVELRRADVASAKANLEYAQKYHSRLKASDRRSVSAIDLDAAASRVTQAKAAVDQANAALKLAQIDLGHCSIKAPISGQIGRAELTKGNYVTPAMAELASIAQVDPVRVKFSVPDRDYLSNIEAFKASKENVFESHITLPDGTVYPTGGARDFEDNTMDSGTGTMTLRVRFNNDGGVLVPGTVVRVAVRPTKSHVALVIPQEALLGDAAGDFVYVVDKEDRIERRGVEIGEDVGGMVEITSGLAEGDRVVVRGQQSIRPGAAVAPHPDRSEGDAPTPADLARQSNYDLTPAETAEPEAK